MGKFTYYLTVREEAPAKFRVRVEPDTPLKAIRDALQQSSDLRYSPILPAYLTPGEEPKAPSAAPTSISFFFAPRPYQSLGKIKPSLSQSERDLVFFTEGLASIVVLNCDGVRAHSLRSEIGCSHMEIWAPQDGLLQHDNIIAVQDPQTDLEGMPFDLTAVGDAAIDVYIEQISASIASLWTSYSRYFPEERPTLTRLLGLAKSLIELHVQLSNEAPSMKKLQQCNAIISSFVELSASLSYSVTQGTSGASPILANRSPFPHHSLLGVGGAVRALTKFTRYLEGAFRTRSAASIIKRQYSTKLVSVPAKISMYESGPPYLFGPPDGPTEEFDSGGDFVDETEIPLLAHFSLRHGYKEAKFSLTAASESLTAESLPAWTLMTLSHEIMHSRVREIFHALFGITWDEDDGLEQWDTFHNEFRTWYESSGKDAIRLDQGIRNVVLNFCLASERTAEIVDARRSQFDDVVSRADLPIYFRKHKRLATELFVHFHDYFFAYACDPKLYIKSLWASWTTVAAPVARPTEYLVRTLATIACGTGIASRAAFEGAVELLQEGLEDLESAGIRSPLFDELRSLLADDRERVFALFKPAYYLIDQVRLNFASRFIADKIDGLEQDPFAEGSTIASDYSSSIYVYGEEESGLIISPIRYSLAALVRQLSGQPPIGDLQWLTAWNSIVISSQEVAQ